MAGVKTGVSGLTPDELYNIQQFGKDIFKGVVGGSPSEVALNAALLPLGPMGRVARPALAGAAAATYSPESEAVLIRLGKEVPKRFEKMKKLAERLRGEGRSGKVFEETEGQLTVAPSGGIEAAYRPFDVETRQLKNYPRPLTEIASGREMFSEVPELNQLLVRKRPEKGNIMGRFIPAEGISLSELALTPAARELGASAGTIGHESQHAVDYLKKLPYGTSAPRQYDDITKMITAIQREAPGFSSQGKRRAEVMLEKLAERSAPQEMYLRNIGESRARAAESLWNPLYRGGGADPYTTASAVRGFAPGSPLTMRGSAYERFVDPSSVILPKDLELALEELRKLK